MFTLSGFVAARPIYGKTRSRVCFRYYNGANTCFGWIFIRKKYDEYARKRLGLFMTAQVIMLMLGFLCWNSSNLLQTRTREVVQFKRNRIEMSQEARSGPG